MSDILTTQAIKPEAYLDLHRRNQLTKEGAYALLHAFFSEHKHLKRTYVLLVTTRDEHTSPITPLLEETTKAHELVESYRLYEDEKTGWKGILVKLG